MIGLALWRARIGCFHTSFKTGTVVTSQLSDTDCHADLSVNDVFVMYCLILLGTGLASCVSTNFTALRDCQSDHIAPYGERVLGTLTYMEKAWFPNEYCEGHSCIALHTSVPFTLCAANAVLSVWRIRLSGDSEMNPGPVDHPDPQGEGRNNASASVSRDLTTPDGTEVKQSLLSCDSLTEVLAAIQSQLRENNDQMRKVRKEQSEQNSLVRTELNVIKDNLQQVSAKCEDISQRCGKLESDNMEFAGRMEDLSTEISQLRHQRVEGRNVSAHLSTQITVLQEEVCQLYDVIDRLESHSRRDNLHMFGVAPVSDKEDYEACARAVCAALNKADNNREWVEDDIVRAHRIGHGRTGEHRPKIIKFQRWKDKMSLFYNEVLRNDLNERGVRFANDLTRTQADVVGTAKREGKAAFFVRGKVTIGPQRPNLLPTWEADDRPSKTRSRECQGDRHTQYYTRGFQVALNRETDSTGRQTQQGNRMWASPPPSSPSQRPSVPCDDTSGSPNPGDPFAVSERANGSDTNSPPRNRAVNSPLTEQSDS